MLTAENLTLRHRLHGVTARFAPGQMTAICGPNGAGKSTLLACLAGLLAPDSGRIDPELPPQARARQLGYLPQSGEVAWDVSVETLVSLGRLPWRDAPGSETMRAIEAALIEMDLVPLRHRPLSHLSGGERARALVARVLAGLPAQGPRWLLADEPLASLDLAHAAALMRALRRQAQSGAGVIVVLHDLAMAMNHGDRVLVLSHGEIAADGPPETALSAEVIARVWSAKATWLGEQGHRALALG
jgi:iron complex transport system ATP-binding protein